MTVSTVRSCWGLCLPSKQLKAVACRCTCTCVHTYMQLVSGLAHPGSSSPAGAVLALLVSAEPCRKDADIMLLLLQFPQAA